MMLYLCSWDITYHSGLEKATHTLSLSSQAPTHDNVFGASDNTDDNASEPPRKKKKLDAAAVDFWASWDMHHVHNEEWQPHPSLLM